MSTGRKSRQNKNSFKNKIRLIVTLTASGFRLSHCPKAYLRFSYENQNCCWS